MAVTAPVPTPTVPTPTATPPTAPNSTLTPVITATGLQSSAAPLAVPTSPPATAAPSLQGAIQGTQQSWQQQLDTAANSAQTGMNTSLSDLLKAELGGGQAQDESAIYGQYGVDKAQKDLTDVNTQLTAEQNALNHKVAAIRQNTGGLFGTGVQQLIDQANTESLSRQADLSVVQLAKQGAYDSAKAIADRAVAAKVEARQNQIAVLGQIYTANKDIFSTAEQHQFEAAQAERTNQLQIDAHKETAKYDEMIKQQDPLYQAQVANTQANTANAYSTIAARSAAGATTINGKPQTAAQTQIQGYADRTLQSESILSSLGSKFASGSLGNVIASSGAFPNLLKSSDRQQYDQAQRDFVNAVLRRESGAAISQSEFDSASKQYFPQPGDAPATIAQKAANRQTVINNLYQQANVPAPVGPGAVIQGPDGKQYQVGSDGETLTAI